ncbi:hypothetical protein [Streptomyces ardesiacus]
MRLLPRGFGAGEQHDVVGVGGDLLKAVAAVVRISGSNDKYNGPIAGTGLALDIPTSP